MKIKSIHKKQVKQLLKINGLENPFMKLRYILREKLGT